MIRIQNSENSTSSNIVALAQLTRIYRKWSPLKYCSTLIPLKNRQEPLNSTALGYNPKLRLIMVNLEILQSPLEGVRPFFPIARLFKLHIQLCDNVTCTLSDDLRSHDSYSSLHHPGKIEWQVFPDSPPTRSGNLKQHPKSSQNFNAKGLKSNNLKY